MELQKIETRLGGHIVDTDNKIQVQDNEIKDVNVCLNNTGTKLVEIGRRIDKVEKNQSNKYEEESVYKINYTLIKVGIHNSLN